MSNLIAAIWVGFFLYGVVGMAIIAENRARLQDAINMHNKCIPGPTHVFLKEFISEKELYEWKLFDSFKFWKWGIEKWIDPDRFEKIRPYL